MALTTATTLSVNKAAYEQIGYFALRPEMYFDAMATVKSTNQAPARGVSVTFTLNNDLAAATTPLSDGVDITPVAMSDTVVTVTPAEYGNAVQLTAKNEATAFYELNPIAANVIGFNAGLTIDTLAANAAVAGTKVAYAGGTVTSRATITRATTVVGNDVRAARSYLAKKHVQRFTDQGVPSFGGLMHPDVTYDFTGSTGGTNWSDPHIYGVDQSGIFNGTIGRFQGVNFMEVPRDPLLFSDAATDTFTISTITVSGNTATLTTSAAHGLKVGSTLTISGATATSGTGSTSQVGFNAQFTVLTVPTTTTLTVDITGKTATCNPGSAEALTVASIDVYATLIVGQQFLAKAFSTGGGYGPNMVMVDLPVTDKLKRITGVGWKHFIGFSVFRQDAVYRIESSSSQAL